MLPLLMSVVDTVTVSDQSLKRALEFSSVQKTKQNKTKQKQKQGEQDQSVFGGAHLSPSSGEVETGGPLGLTDSLA